MNTQDDLRHQAFLRIGGTDFPDHLDAYLKLWPSTERHMAGDLSKRIVQREYQDFFKQHRPPWPRYQAYIQYWDFADPDSSDDDDPPGVVCAEQPWELLLHRVLSASYMAERQARYLIDADYAPWWRLVVVADGRVYPECLAASTALHRYDSDFWRKRELPCERLFCNCRIQALTEHDASEFQSNKGRQA
ncbi:MULTISPECIES: hypothetical protein [Comamonas]|uniref:hypothetical protein n=1 Tax=Comamonas TaxID=283 RepID=UPI0010399C35|nr:MULTISPECIES: hypothetical protein [Comamonas]TFF63093.1 hypothetical protein EIC84_03345 [Comamonas sp. A23]